MLKVLIFDFKLGPLVKMMDSMRRIRAVSRDLLTEKLNESLFITSDDRLSKRDIMSLLIHARTNAEKVEMDPKSEKTTFSSDEYRMSNDEMIEQMVRISLVGRVRI